MIYSIYSSIGPEGISIVYNVNPLTRTNFDGPEGMKDRFVSKRGFNLKQNRYTYSLIETSGI